jgi:hypothetical protein
MAAKSPPDPQLINLVYDEAMRALSEQSAALDGLRTRAGLILSAASIASSFLGGLALQQGSLDVWSWLGIGAFVFVGALAFVILWPYAWSFNFEPHVLFSDYVDTEPPSSVVDAKRNLAKYAGDYLADNDRILRVLWWVYRVAIILLVLQIAFWLIDISQR